MLILGIILFAVGLFLSGEAQTTFYLLGGMLIVGGLLGEIKDSWSLDRIARAVGKTNGDKRSEQNTEPADPYTPKFRERGFEEEDWGKFQKRSQEYREAKEKATEKSGGSEALPVFREKGFEGESYEQFQQRIENAKTQAPPR